jgi:putative polyketide hydroxylase
VRRAQERVSTLDLYERTPVLLSDAGDPSGWHRAAVRLAQRIPVPLTSYRVGTGTGADLVTDGDADWAQAHGVTRGGAVLVRPDGFVAWRSAGPVADAETVLHEVLAEALALD